MSARTEYVIERDGEPAVVFTGALIGEASSHASHKDRWSELRLYVTDGGKYVRELVGRSNRRGEIDIVTATVASSADELVEQCRTIGLRSAGHALVGLARRALREASRYDTDLHRAVTAREAGTVHID